MKETLKKSAFFVLPTTQKRHVPDNQKYALIVAFSCLLIVTGLLIEGPLTVGRGLWQLMISPDILLTDYIAITNLGTAFVNSGLVTLLSTLLAKKLRVKMSGPLVAALYTMCGFAFFGKNIFNSLPIMLGVWLYAKWQKKPFSHFILVNLFGTALAPAVSLVAFGLGLETSEGLLLGIAVGVIIGLLLPPLSVHFLSFHQGFNLYNIGFTAGIVGMFLTAILRLLGYEIVNVSHLSSGNNVFLSLFLFGSFSVLLVFGFIYNTYSFKGYRGILKSSGKLITDFMALDGYGITLINMALMGIVATAYVLLVGGQLNGAVIGGIFTVVGFSAFGGHLRNNLPIFLGVYLACWLTGVDVSSTGALLAALFGTTLAPLSGYYGVLVGVLAGGLHLALVSNVGFLHGGINLYNNGFSGGFIAAFLVPILDSFANALALRKGKN